MRRAFAKPPASLYSSILFLCKTETYTSDDALTQPLWCVSSLLSCLLLPVVAWGKHPLHHWFSPIVKYQAVFHFESELSNDTIAVWCTAERSWDGVGVGRTPDLSSATSCAPNTQRMVLKCFLFFSTKPTFLRQMLKINLIWCALVHWGYCLHPMYRTCTSSEGS